ncbi:exosporium morphogenetic protein CdeC [Terrisporobacter vanillatitrophus]|uniref:exosporium morphogenetic protein CdeC n=1 Tax=Terrisporobacter vanillatitrophus TaxID=3058402 RepID=UPI003365D16A
MNDLKRSKRKMHNKQMSAIKNTCEQEATVEIDELDRGCKHKNNTNNDNLEQTQPISQGKNCHPKHEHETCHPKHEHEICECECVCECKKPSCEPCEPCQVESDTCVANPCAGDQCCDGLRPSFSTKNASPVAIEADRIFDSVQFQIFTDATGPNGETLFFDFDVVEVDGSVPTTGLANVVIDEVCMNFSSLEVVPGIPTVEDFEVTEIEDNAPCDTVFEYAVCPERNATCCAQNRGQSLSYKERGLTVIANDLVLELRGHCGCTKIVALAFPAVKKMGGQLCRVDSVEFRFNTLAARICCPSSGRAFKLRQDYQVALTVDCISKAFISAEDCCGCDCDCFELTIPSGIDLIACVEETVSVLVSDQLVVLGVSGGVTPRVVDTFANVCNFPSCGSN